MVSHMVAIGGFHAPITGVGLTFAMSPITAMKSPTPNPNGAGIFFRQSQLRNTLCQRIYWQMADLIRRAHQVSTEYDDCQAGEGGVR